MEKLAHTKTKPEDIIIIQFLNGNEWFWSKKTKKPKSKSTASCSVYFPKVYIGNQRSSNGKTAS